MFDWRRHFSYQGHMTESPDDSMDPYRAPDAALTGAAEAGPVSEKAMRYLTSTRWGMWVVGIALIANALLICVAAVLLARAGAARTGLVLVLVVLMAGITFLPGLRLVQCAKAVSLARRTLRERDILLALQRHQQFWMLAGLAILLVGGLVYLIVGFLRFRF